MSWWDTLQRRRAAREARRWFVRLHGGSESANDEREHLAWLQASPRNARAYADVQAVWSAVGGVQPAAAPTRDEYVRVWPQWSVAAAAAVVATVGALALGGEFTAPRPYATAVAEARTIELPDGSRMILAPDSRASVAINWRQRDVRLERGQAYFEVAHERWRRFSVETTSAEVVVHGTKFDVHTGPDGTRVAVAEGRVAVAPVKPDAASPASSAELTRGETVGVTERGALTPLERLDPKLVSAWRTGRLVFKDTPLSTVVADINRYSKRLVMVNDPAIADMRVTALFRTDDVASILMGLESVLPIKVVPTGKDQFALISNAP